jgi:hypothetical protein
MSATRTQAFLTKGDNNSNYRGRWHIVCHFDSIVNGADKSTASDKLKRPRNA